MYKSIETKYAVGVPGDQNEASLYTNEALETKQNLVPPVIPNTGQGYPISKHNINDSLGASENVVTPAQDTSQDYPLPEYHEHNPNGEVEAKANSTPPAPDTGQGYPIPHELFTKPKADTDLLKGDQFHNLYDLLNMDLDDEPYLVDNYIPKVGVSLLVARPDIGKSMFMRGMALHIIQKKDTFLDMKLNHTTGNVLYVSTEDDKRTSVRVMKKIIASHGVLKKEEQERLEFLHTETTSPSELVEKLRAKLSYRKVDLVILDAYGDVFSGKDSNSNSQVREFLKEYYQIATTHDCLLMFVHHINKARYDERPAQQNVSGAGSLSQKSRNIMELLSVSHDPNLRYLIVTKGNSVPRQHKQYAIELKFSEEDFSFTPTGNTRHIDEWDKKTGQDGRYNTRERIQRNYNHVFLPDEIFLSYNEIVRRAQPNLGISEIQAKRDIKERLIKNTEGLYSTPEIVQRGVYDRKIDRQTIVPTFTVFEHLAWNIPRRYPDGIVPYFMYWIVPTDGEPEYWYENRSELQKQKIEKLRISNISEQEKMEEFKEALLRIDAEVDPPTPTPKPTPTYRVFEHFAWDIPRRYPNSEVPLRTYWIIPDISSNEYWYEDRTEAQQEAIDRGEKEALIRDRTMKLQVEADARERAEREAEWDKRIRIPESEMWALLAKYPDGNVPKRTYFIIPSKNRSTYWFEDRSQDQILRMKQEMVEPQNEKYGPIDTLRELYRSIKDGTRFL